MKVSGASCFLKALGGFIYLSVLFIYLFIKDVFIYSMRERESEHKAGEESRERDKQVPPLMRA